MDTQLAGSLFPEHTINTRMESWKRTLIFVFGLLGKLTLISVLSEAASETVTQNRQPSNQATDQSKRNESSSQQTPLRMQARVSLPPQNVLIVSAPEAGLVTHVNVELGAKVSHRQLLAEINSPHLLSLQRTMLDSLEDLKMARIRLERDQSLLDSGIISKIKWQETESEFEHALLELQESEQILVAGGFGPEEIGLLKSNRKLKSTLNIFSPVTGRILEIMVTSGQRVDLLAPLFRIGKTDEIWLEIDAPQAIVGEIHQGDKLTVEPINAKARVTFIGQNISQDSSTTPIRATLEENADDLRPGQKVTVQLSTGKRE